MSEHLGKITFLDTPDVNGADVITSTTLTGALTNLVVPGTEGLGIPAGTTAQRPVAPITGEARQNTTIGYTEVWNASAWLPMGKVIQSVAGQITSKAATNIPFKTTTTIPLSTEGTDIWTQSFTPQVVGSTIVVQYTLSGYLSIANRALFTSVFAGANNCIGMTVTAAPVAGANAAIGTYNLAMQCVYTSVSTAAVTFSARLGGLHTSAANITVGVNQSVSAGNYGGAMQTEYRILEMI